MNVDNPGYTIVCDTREKKGWTFTKRFPCIGIVHQKLDSGDYTLQGFEDILCIERKGSVAEFAHNVIEARFEAELCRMDDYKYSFILLEFELADLLFYPNELPRYIAKKCKYTGKFILKKMTTMLLLHKPHIIFCGSNGREMALRIFKEVYEFDG